MNRVLYQLSYAAMGGHKFRTCRNSFVIIYTSFPFVKKIIRIFRKFLGILVQEVGCVKLKKPAILFCVGGLAYVGLELLWRGRSHVSMFLTGGSCFLLLGKLGKQKPRLPLLARGCMGALVITSAELLAGLLVNRSYTVWDYRQEPLNFYGQICLPFSLLWIPVSLGAMYLYGLLSRILETD